MTDYTDPTFNRDTLKTFQGYSLQVFSSGRIKLSFHRTHTDRVEYYAEWPKRDAEAFDRQQRRSLETNPNHFALVDLLRSQCSTLAILRIHLKGNNNATADNAHVLLLPSTNTCHVILGTLHHRWEFPSEVMQAFYSRRGSRKGSASIFNEYMRSYDHDWDDASFTADDYSIGVRSAKPVQHRHWSIEDDPDLSF